MPWVNNPVYNMKKMGVHYTWQNVVYGIENIFQDTT